MGAKVKVRLFARLSDLAGVRHTEVEPGEGLTAGDAYRLLCARFPGLSAAGGALVYAVNSEYVPEDHPLKGGDELALIPPVSGGCKDPRTENRELRTRHVL